MLHSLLGRKTRTKLVYSLLLMKHSQPHDCRTEPQAGLDTCTRAGTLAQLIVEKINEGGDPGALLSYNPVQWKNSSNIPYAVEYHWLRPTVNVTINGHEDAFSPRGIFF